MSTFGNGYYSITTPSGREYLVSFAGRKLNSAVFVPRDWSNGSIGLSHVAGGGVHLGGGSARWVDFKARRVIRSIEHRIHRAEARHARDARYLGAKP